MQHNHSETNIKQLQNVARKQFSTKDYNGAIDTLNKILQYQPNDISTLLNKGAALFFMHSYNDALECFDHVLKVQPDHLQALKNKAGTLFNLGRYAESNDTYDIILATTGSNEDIILKNKALVLIKLNRIHEAISIYQVLIAQNDQDTSMLLKLANLYQQIQQYDQAIATYNKLLEKDTKNVDLLNKKALLLALKKSYNKAIEVFDQILAIDPYNREALLNKEDALYHLQIDLLEADEYSDKAKETIQSRENINKQQTTPHSTTRVEETKHVVEPNDVKTITHKQLIEEPSKIEKLINRGDSLVVKQAYEKALSYYKQALELDPNNQQALLGKGYVLRLLKEYTAAIDCYNTILKQSPNNIKALIQKGQTLISMKDYDLAMSCFEQVLRLDPKNFDAICGKEDTIDSRNKDQIRSSHALPNFENKVQEQNLDKEEKEEPNQDEDIFEDEDEDEEILEDIKQEIVEEKAKTESYSNVEHISPAYIPQINKLEVIEHAHAHAHLPSYKQESMLDLAVESVQNREYEKALRYFDLVTNNSLHCINTLYYKALAHTYTQQFNKAIKCCEMIIEQEPQHLTALNLRTKIMELQKTFAAAADENREEADQREHTYTRENALNNRTSYTNNNVVESKKLNYTPEADSKQEVESNTIRHTTSPLAQSTTHAVDNSVNRDIVQNTYDTGSQRIDAESNILHHTVTLDKQTTYGVNNNPTITISQKTDDTSFLKKETESSTISDVTPSDKQNTYLVDDYKPTVTVKQNTDNTNSLKKETESNTISEVAPSTKQSTYLVDDYKPTVTVKQNTDNTSSLKKETESSTISDVTPSDKQNTYLVDDYKPKATVNQNTDNTSSVRKDDTAKNISYVAPSTKQSTYVVDTYNPTAIVKNNTAHVDYETQYLFDEANRLYQDGKYEEVISLLESEKESNHQAIKELYEKANTNLTIIKAKDKAQSFVERGYNSLTLLSALGSQNKQKIHLSSLMDELIELNQNDYFSQIVNKNNTLRSKYKAIYIQALQIVYQLQVNQEIENKVAHYTSHRISNELLIPANEEGITPPFRLYSIANSRDPKEGTTLFDLLKVNQFEDQSSPHYQAFVGSFSFNTESLNQFRLYSKNSKQEAIGVSIVLNETFFNQDTEAEQKKLENLYRCVYIDPKTRKIISVGHKEEYTIYRENATRSLEQITAYQAHISELLKTLKTEFARLNALLEDHELDSNIVCQLLIVLRYLVKHVAHKDEQECRIIKIEQIIDKKVQLKNRQLFINYESMNKHNVQMVYTTPLTKQYKVLKDIVWKETGIHLLMSDYPLTKDND